VVENKEVSALPAKIHSSYNKLLCQISNNYGKRLPQVASGFPQAISGCWQDRVLARAGGGSYCGPMVGLRHGYAIPILLPLLPKKG